MGTRCVEGVKPVERRRLQPCLSELYCWEAHHANASLGCADRSGSEAVDESHVKRTKTVGCDLHLAFDILDSAPRPTTKRDPSSNLVAPPNRCLCDICDGGRKMVREPSPIVADRLAKRFGCCKCSWSSKKPCKRGSGQAAEYRSQTPVTEISYRYHSINKAQNSRVRFVSLR